LSTISHPLYQSWRGRRSYVHRQVVPWYHTMSGD